MRNAWPGHSSHVGCHSCSCRVLERYPNNGKLLRCYGKFLEDVKHDPAAAARAYGEANRNGGGDVMLSLDLSGVQGAADKPDFLTSMSMEDAVVVINAEGTILMVSQVGAKRGCSVVHAMTAAAGLRAATGCRMLPTRPNTATRSAATSSLHRPQVSRHLMVPLYGS